MTVLLAAILGVALGPTLYHLAVRSAQHASFLPLPSACPNCGTARSLRRWFRGACPQCGDPRSRGELLVVVLGGVVFAGAVWVADDPLLIPAFVVFGAVTLILGVADVRAKLIPNRILYPGGAAALALLAVGALAIGDVAAVLRMAAGGAAYFGVLFIVAVIARGGFGFGDVKLAALLGAFTAFESVRIFLIGIFFTGMLGGIPALVLLATRRARPKDELPYGPAMIGGAWAALVIGDAFLRWYTG